MQTVGVQIAKSNVSSVNGSSSERKTFFLSDEGPTLETLDFTIRIGSRPTFCIFQFIYECVDLS